MVLVGCSLVCFVGVIFTAVKAIKVAVDFRTLGKITSLEVVLQSSKLFFQDQLATLFDMNKLRTGMKGSQSTLPRFKVVIVGVFQDLTAAIDLSPICFIDQVVEFHCVK